jgi:two-component sensor histidine kinase
MLPGTGQLRVADVYIGRRERMGLADKSASSCTFSVMASSVMASTVSDPGAARARHEASPELSAGELQHRIRNILSVIQYFVSQTDAGTAEEYREALTARITALFDAYSQIDFARDNILLTELLGRTLRPYVAVRADRIVAAGPDVELESRLALSLHMIFHELATNASKHGALTSTSGKIEVLWDFIPAGADWKLAMQWIERGGPKVQEPARKGLGLGMITKLLPDAQVEVDFNRSGLVCRMLIDATDLRPVRRLLEVGDPHISEAAMAKI